MNIAFKNPLLSLLLVAVVVTTLQAHAAERPILLIGASFADGRAPYNQGLISPIPGGSVNFGSYDGLKDVFIRRGYRVISTAQGGATTHSRVGCGPTIGCGPGVWDGYDIQLERAISYVRDNSNPQAPTLNANYVYISFANDCLHPNAAGLPWDVAKPCTTAEINHTVDRFIAAGKKALNSGITPVYGKYPRYSDLDLELFRGLVGFPWVIDEAGYNKLRNLLESRIAGELPEAIYVKTVWSEFKHLGDGIHPDSASVKRAVEEISAAIAVHANNTGMGRKKGNLLTAVP